MEAGPIRREPAAGASGARTRVKLPVDPYSAAPRPPRLRGPLIAGGLVVTLFAVIALVNQGGKGGSPKSTAATSAASAPATGSPSPLTTTYDAGQASNTADGVPVGYPHSGSGAEAAAANYVVAYYSAEMVHSWYRVQLLNAIADPAAAADLRTQLDAAYTQTDGTYGLSSSGSAPAGQTFVQRAAPVGVTLVRDSGSSATVSVWVVTLAGIAGTNSQHAVTEDWATVTLTLNWTHGDWKWFSFQAVDGPAPLGGLQTPAPAATLQAAVTKYGGLRYGR